MCVGGPDTVSVTPSGSTHVVNEGKVLDDITCTAECVPSCTYEWKKNGTSFRTERTLSLGQLTRSDSGLYTCIVGKSDTGIQVTKNIDVTVNVRCKYNIVIRGLSDKFVDFLYNKDIIIFVELIFYF